MASWPARIRTAWLGGVLIVAGSCTEATGLREPGYNRDIRPILSDNCFRCHGPELKSRKAKMRLDVREVAVEKGAIVPGQPDESEMIARLETDNPDDHMPPADTHKVVTPAQIAILRRWIAAGAKYEPHWSYAPLVRPAVPTASDPAWTRGAIDHFVLARLDESKIAPAPAADRRTLLRRLSLDLTGLPPTPQEVERFVKDRSATAYAKQVERLLASPHYGERMAVPWLDAARFTDTVGYHGDQNQNIFPYRDYVIESFNRNQPFDQFTIEQLAGDLLPNPTVPQKIATGFNRLNMMTREGGAQPMEYLAKYQADRVRTVSTAWLGSTMACCECHDHKYDPFTIRDFYSLAAFFGDVKQWGVYQDYSYTPNAELKGWSNEHPFPPEILVASPYLAQRKARLDQQLGEALSGMRARLRTDRDQLKAFEQWVAMSREFLSQQPEGWLAPAPTPVMVKGGKVRANTNATVSADGVVRFTKKPAGGEEQGVELLPGAGRIAALRLAVFPKDIETSKPGEGQQRQGLKLSIALRPAKGESRKLAIYYADADFKEPRYSSTAEILGVVDGWQVSRRQNSEKQTSVWMLDPPLVVGEGDVLSVTLGGDTAVPVRLAVSPFGADNPLQVADSAVRKAFETPARQRTREQRELLANTYLFSTAWDAEAFARFKKLQREILECRGGVIPTMITVATTNRLVTRVLPRGNWQDESGPVVAPAVPHFLPQPNLTARTRSRDWIWPGGWCRRKIRSPPALL